MKKVIYILIRYSVFLENDNSWQISRNDKENYKNNLFNEDRLEKHFELFKNITLPSLVKQDDNKRDIDFKVFLITSEELPQWNKKLLEEISEKYSWLTLNYLPPKGLRLTYCVEEDLKSYNEEILFASARLDDDDALANNFIKSLSSYLKYENVGKGISFANGLWGLYDFELGQYRKVVELYKPKIALGLSYINSYNNGVYGNEIKTIFNAGRHTKIDYKLPLILDSREVMFIRTMAEYSDSYTMGEVERTLNKPLVDTKVILENFSLNGFNEEVYLEENVPIEITKEPVYELKRLEFDNEGRIHIEGVFFLEGVPCSNYSDVQYILKFKSKYKVYEINLAKSKSRTKLISDLCSKNALVDYSAAYFCTEKFKGIDISHVTPGEYRIFIEIIMHTGDRCEISLSSVKKLYEVYESKSFSEFFKTNALNENSVTYSKDFLK